MVADEGDDADGHEAEDGDDGFVDWKAKYENECVERGRVEDDMWATEEGFKKEEQENMLLRRKVAELTA